MIGPGAPPPLTDAEIAAMAPIGTRVYLARDVERFPHAIAVAGEVGTITHNTDRSICVKLDQYHSGLKSWGNDLVWSDDALLDFLGDVAFIPKGACEVCYHVNAGHTCCPPGAPPPLDQEARYYDAIIHEIEYGEDGPELRQCLDFAELHDCCDANMLGFSVVPRTESGEIDLVTVGRVQQQVSAYLQAFERARQERDRQNRIINSDERRV